MCGFVININESEITDNFKKKFFNLSKKNFHRGPDQISLFNDKKISVLFRRLSIIDITKKSGQPFFSKDKRFLLIFNGEIYNYKEIKSKLIEKGIFFKSDGDAEVLLEAFIFYGNNFIKYIRGMFSFCIWDFKKNQLIAFRDRFGQKPLYYYQTRNQITFSSEIKDIIFLHKDFVENSEVVRRYLIRSFSEEKNQTFFKKIFRVPPGSYIIYKNNKVKIGQYYKVRSSEKIDYNKEEFKKIFFDSINLHNRSDVKTAYLLSGGLDSSSLVASSDHLGFKPNCFSVIPEGTFNEKPYINKIVKIKKINHEYLKYSYKNLDFTKMVKSHDEPVRSSSCIYQYLLRAKIKERGFKVLVTGEGADEIFGGYKRMLTIFLYNTYLKGNKSLLLKNLKDFNLNNDLVKNVFKKTSLILKKNLPIKRTHLILNFLKINI